jgi:integrative and conjugative element protein (TIGR02256 family)
VPRALCLYFEPWKAARITWTPRRFLDRILWWLSQTAIGQLHRGDQPVERLYFPFEHQLFLDSQFAALREREHRRIDIVALTGPEAPNQRFLGHLAEAGGPPAGTPVSYLTVELENLLHGVNERHPVTLGELADQLTSRGGTFLTALEAALRGRASGHPISLKTEKQPGLLLVGLSMQREPGVQAERRDYQAFLFKGGIGKLGEALGWLTRDSVQGFLYTPMVLSSGPQSDLWRSIPLDPVEVVESLSVDWIRALAGTRDTNGEFPGVLAGVGALGSTLLNLWAREAWGSWTLFDADYIRPHNPIRHEARSDAIGYDKVSVLEQQANAVHAGRKAVVRAVPRALSELADPETQQLLSTATLVVDATTTLDLPRDLSRQEGASRSASVFLTPSAGASVLMLEDAQRQLRLDQIEAQYYRAVLRETWGQDHLKGHLGEYWVGGSCRDVSAVMSPETVQLHAALLSRSLRTASEDPKPRLRIWQSDAEMLSIQQHEIPLAPSTRMQRGDWSVLVDERLLHTARAIRTRHLPEETGGILLGAVDQHRRTIALVDALAPPDDSVGTPTSFARGTESLAEAVEEASRRTAGIVGYVGEWHSHPPHASTDMSPDDLRQLLHLTVHLGSDGDPAVMLIVGEAEWSVIVGEVRH